MEFNPRRLDLARRRRGMTKHALAEAAGISQRSLVGYYAQKREPNSAIVGEMSQVLRFPAEFFYGPTLEEPPKEGTSFRALSTVSARLRDQAIATATIGLSVSDWIGERFTLPLAEIPRYERIDPEMVAADIRRTWQLGEHPIRNMVHLLELHGIRVFALAVDALKIDAFSFWRGDIPYVFLNTKKSPERSRMDAAHELGHLVLHWKNGAQRDRQAELEAQHFGAAFLMPRGSVIARAPRRPSLNQIIQAKKLWMVSVANLTYRMHRLGLLSDHHFRTLFTEMGRRSMRTKEPDSVPRETSQVLTKVLNALKGQGITTTQMAKALQIHPEELNTLFIGLVNRPLALG